MIYKHFETNKIDLTAGKIILFYGKNNGLKNETLKNLIGKKYKKTLYEEKEILENSSQFLDKILNRSLFDAEEAIIIKRASDKIFDLVNEIASKSIEDLIIIINSENLEKRSKLRSFFERSKKEVCMAFYPDNEQTLIKIASNFFKERNIPVSFSDINLLVNKSGGDRGNLLNELEKIETYTKNGKKLCSETILKLTNLFENHDISILVDNCLSKNKNKIIKILNENNFTGEDSIAIVKIFLSKSKRILNLINQFEKNNNINLTIASAQPPIFWKDKDITKQQICKWNSKEIKKILYKLSEIEFLIKKDSKNSLNIICDFILNLTHEKINNYA
tara:strand:- start:245 stop:1243 length:999 start_codon:yes stop_codon:yes gene_type:complete